MELLRTLERQLDEQIRSSIKKCCCFHFDEIIFGRHDQAQAILKETFDGIPLLLDGSDGNKIDCMFFPCTQGEKVVIDYRVL